MDDKITTIYVGPRPTNLPPGALVRRWDTSIAFGIFVGATVSVISAAVMHALGPAPPGNVVDAALDAVHWLQQSLGNIDAEPSGAFILWAREHAAWTALVRPGLALMLGAVCGGFATKLALIPRSQEILIAGSPVLTGDSARQAARRLTKSLARDADPAWKLIHPLLRLPRSIWSRHVLLYGSSGSGKTTILWPILRSIVRRNHKALIYDSKGDFTAGTPDSVAILSPWDARSVVWDIATDVATRSDAAAFSESMIPDSKEPVFANSARSILVGILVSLQNDSPGSWTWADIAKRRRLSPESLHALMAEHHPDDSSILYPPDGKQAANFIANFLAMTQPLASLAQAWGAGDGRERWSVREWIKDKGTGPRQVLLQGNGSERPAHIAALIDVAAHQIVSPTLPDSRKRALFFVLDELPTLGKLAGLRPLLDKGRSKGCCCLLGFQDFSQIAEAYNPHLSKAIGSMVGTHIIGQISPGETRDTVAKQLGRLRVASLQTNTSLSAGGHATSTSYQEKERDALLSSELTDTLGPRSLDPKRNGGASWGVRCLLITGGSILRLDWPGVTAPQKRAARVPAPWTVPTTASAPVVNDDATASETKTAPIPRDDGGLAVVHALPQAVAAEKIGDDGAEIAGIAATHLVLPGPLAAFAELLASRQKPQDIAVQSELTPEE